MFTGRFKQINSLLISMRVDILNVRGEEVEFSCSFGKGSAICTQRNVVPGMICDVEVDILPDLQIGVNAQISEDDTLFWRYNGKENVINAEVEMIDDTDGICLRLASDCIIMCYHVPGGISVGGVLLITLGLQDVKVTITGI
jgi:hypothetical protein